MKNNKNLNPLNDPEVAEMLTMSPDDQLWSFLDDCVPYDGKDAVLVMMGDFDVDNKNEDGNITINGVPYCAMITDMIFEKSEEELLSMPLTKQYEKYFAIQKECYRPYFTECCILDDYNDLTEEQHDFLDELETGSILAVSLKNPENAVSVRVSISFVGCGRDICKEGWLPEQLLVIVR